MAGSAGQSDLLYYLAAERTPALRFPDGSAGPLSEWGIRQTPSVGLTTSAATRIYFSGWFNL